MGRRANGEGSVFPHLGLCVTALRHRRHVREDAQALSPGE